MFLQPGCDNRVYDVEVGNVREAVHFIFYPFERGNIWRIIFHMTETAKQLPY